MLSELRGRLDDLRQDQRHMLERLDRLVDRSDLENAAQLWAVQIASAERQHDADMTAVGRRLDSLEEWQTWAVRIVVGGVVTALLGLLLALGGTV